VFATLGDAHQRGQQVGVREAMAAMIGIAAPLLAGWALTRFGAKIAFGATALVLLSAAAPLLWTPNIVPKRRAPKALRAALPGVLLFACDGWIACGLYFGWQLALFVTLGENFQSYGGAMAVAALAGAVGGLVLGRLIDDGHGRRAAFLALGVLATVTLARAASIGNPGFALFANALGALVSCLYVPTLMTVVYNKSQASPCVARFHIAAEGGWDIGGSTALLTAALLVHEGEGLRTVILLSLPGVIAAFVLLYRHYGVRVLVPPVATAPLAGGADGASG
jgi:MFS family permease